MLKKPEVFHSIVVVSSLYVHSFTLLNPADEYEWGPRGTKTAAQSQLGTTHILCTTYPVTQVSDNVITLMESIRKVLPCDFKSSQETHATQDGQSQRWHDPVQGEDDLDDTAGNNEAVKAVKEGHKIALKKITSY